MCLHGYQVIIVNNNDDDVKLTSFRQLWQPWCESLIELNTVRKTCFWYLVWRELWFSTEAPYSTSAPVSTSAWRGGVLQLRPDCLMMELDCAWLYVKNLLEKEQDKVLQSNVVKVTDFGSSWWTSPLWLDSLLLKVVNVTAFVSDLTDKPFHYQVVRWWIGERHRFW